VRPGLDDKVLTSWNALMIAAMAHAARVFGRPEWLESARRALRFLREKAWNDGRLLATYKDGRAHLDAYSTTTRTCSPRCRRCCRPTSSRATCDGPSELGDTLLERFHDASGRLLLHRARPREAHPAAQAGPDNATPRATACARWRCIASPSSPARCATPRRRRGTIALFWPQMERQPRRSARCSPRSRSSSSRRAR
jgi:uncharacterized protein YyaL (SSP411 family)